MLKDKRNGNGKPRPEIETVDDDEVSTIAKFKRSLRDTTKVTISPPNFAQAKLKIVGTAPYCMNKMSSANRLAIIQKQEAGSTQAKKSRKLPPKDFDKVYKGAMHIAKQGWHGIPCAGLRDAMIEACVLVGFHKTVARKAVFVLPDGFDRDDGQPLTKIYGKPIRRDTPVKQADGSTTIIARPFFDKYHAIVTVRWDADFFTAQDILNLLSRAGLQVGIGAGRHYSKKSSGMGWGTFEVRA